MKKPEIRTLPRVERLAVYLELSGHPIELGTLAWSQGERCAYFEYSRDFLDAPLPISPINLATSPGLKAAPHQPFDGLHGLFNDSLPDGWGRLLLDRYLQAQNFEHRGLGPLDRLAYVGESGMGALRYRPDKKVGDKEAHEANLDWFAKQAEQVQRELPTADIDRLIQVQGGSAGARPKIMIGLDLAKETAMYGRSLPAGYEPWIVKFKSSNDPEEIGAEEYAYSLMAKAAGISMAPTKLLKTSKGNYFAARRFDRTPNGSIHIHTVSGLLDVDHRTPQIDYDTLLRLTRILTRDESHLRQMFRRMAFNVLAHNRDDHSKNHAFRMEPDGSWHPTPAYDLTLSDGPAGEHSLAVAGEGRNPGQQHIMKVASDASIPKGEADAIVEQVRLAIGKWPEYAEAAALSDRRTSEVNNLLK